MVDIHSTDNPEVALNKWLAEPALADDTLVVEYDYHQYYLPGAPPVRLMALYRQMKDQVLFTVTAADSSISQGLPSMDGSLAGFQNFIACHKLPVFTLGQPLILEPVSIAKPWGQEIWYTGIEARGVSRVSDGTSSVPLPWLLSVAPCRLAADSEKNINLLKILDPLPEAVYGDLYFELHKEKREVYVVTHIDKDAWPEGVGAIRFGFNPEYRAEYPSDDAFKTAYQNSVQHYEVVRREVDSLLDSCRQSEGVDLNTPVSAEIVKSWMSQLPEALRQQEANLREQMNRFSALLPLRVGDVVQVPLLTPHSLQHGVRTVEFQTPVYERMILSFAQKVLTQTHWDTEKAIAMMSLEAPSLPELALLKTDADYKLEEVVRFDDFRVLRLTLSPSARYLLPQTQRYGLLLVVDAEVDCHGIALAEEAAVLLPAERSNTYVTNTSNREAVLLLASPV
ncbi:MAG TPA: hypothetical protein ENI05_03925 [Porticoccus sp.]|nr:hypothetical protein [Porticoccus sp.]